MTVHKKSFYDFVCGLDKQKDDNFDDFNDLIYDIRHDSNFPRSEDNFETLKNYLRCRGACLYFLDLFDILWHKYLNEKKEELKMVIVSDIIRDNDPNTVIKVKGKNPIDDCDPWAETYYHGRLGDIPDSLRNCSVLRTGWLIGSQCHCIEIPYIKNQEEHRYGK